MTVYRLHVEQQRLGVAQANRRLGGRPINTHARLPIVFSAVIGAILMVFAGGARAADKGLLDVLLENGAITQEQYENLLEQETLTSADILQETGGANAADETPVAEEVTELDDTSMIATHVGSGFRFETRDGNWRTELQWRAQLRATSPINSDPRQLSSFGAEDQVNFEARRLRMKIGGYGYQPWMEYYFEVDLQPFRDVDDSVASSSAQVIDWRADIAKWNWGGIRVGQWKVDLNRERVDSSGRQQFVERSIVNRIFTIDRQVGVQVRGRAFKDTRADLRYWAGVFNGEGKGTRNYNSDMMYMARLQWNFLGRDLSWRQTDIEYTEMPTGSLAIAGFTNTSACTRWSSSGCGNLDGFQSPLTADPDQFEIDQAVQEFAFKYRGLSIQQEYHEKNILDSSDGRRYELTGGYLQAGYFFHNLFEKIPAPLEFAARFAAVNEPNAVNRTFENERREYTIGANWFFSGHNNKLTVDLSRLTLDDGLVGIDESENRLRFQWDVSF
jgi:phosphate-selective porin